MAAFAKSWRGSSYGTHDAAAHRTRAREPVLHRNRRQPCRFGITAHAMQSMAIKGFIVNDRESGAYALTDSGRAALLATLGDAGLT
jgi:hypothetical protein